jgi:hypothetical protein
MAGVVRRQPSELCALPRLDLGERQPLACLQAGDQRRDRRRLAGRHRRPDDAVEAGLECHGVNHASPQARK